MQTIRLVVNKNRKPRQILEMLQRKKLKRGDKLKIRNGDYDFASAVLVLLIVIAWYFNKNALTKRNFSNEIEESLFDKKLSPEKLEEQIKKEFDITIESDNDEDDFKTLAKSTFAKTFDDDEPDYSGVMVKEQNPHYKKR